MNIKNLLKIIFSFALQTFFNLEAIKVISLGDNCTNSITMRALSIRKEAHPFDWLITDFEALYQTLDDNFNKFLDIPTLKTDIEQKAVIDFYGLKFVHDFPTKKYGVQVGEELHQGGELREDWRNFIPEVREKYKRRINRFFNALNGKEHCFLVRNTLTKENAIRLRYVIEKRFPYLTFTIIAINNFPEENWNISKVKNFFIKYPPTATYWIDWQKLCASFGIYPNTVT